MPAETTPAAAPDTTPTASTVAAPAAPTDPTAAAPAVPDGGEAPAAPAPSKPDDLAAFKAGVATVTPAVAPTQAGDTPTPSTLEVMRDATGRFVPKPGAPAAPEPKLDATGKPIAPAAAATPPAAAKPEAPKPDAKIEEEIKALGITNEKSQARFRELSATEREFAPIREALKTAGITKAEDLPRVIASAGRAAEWENAVASTGASPEQFGATMQYTALAVRANQGDLEAAKAAYQAASVEAAHWAKMLGVEAPGVDPLAAHPDLLKEIEAGDITRARALELVQVRAQAKIVETRAHTTDTQTAANRALEQGRNDVAALDAHFAATDPDYARKMPLLTPMLRVIRANVHPAKWKETIQQAYAELPAMPAPAPAAAAPTPPAPQPRAPITPMPSRPTGGAGAPMVRVPKDDLEAFKMGVASVR